MISPEEFLAYLTKIDGGCVSVDLFKIASGGGGCKQTQSGKNAPGGGGAIGTAAGKAAIGKLRLALDMEDCLDRFYGGYYSDWACGGQWNRAFEFVHLMVAAFQKANIEVVAFFDGSLRENKRWTLGRSETRERVLSVLKHIRMIGTPPPKVWWLPPSGLRTAIRNAMRTLNIPLVQTVNDHSMEVLAYYHDNRLDGILGLSPDYVVRNVTRFFSSHDLRLSYKGTLECKEFMVAKLLTNCSLTPDHLPFLAALFGGYTLLTEAQLKKIYAKLEVNFGDDSETRIRKIAEIVRNSPTNDLAEFVKHLQLHEWQEELKESVEYYQRKGKFAAGKIKFQIRKRVQIETAFAKDQAGKQGNANSSCSSVKNPPPEEEIVALASETNENDEMARKILLEVNNLVDEGDVPPSELFEEPPLPQAKADKKKDSSKSANKSGQKGNNVNFVYTLPSEILKTALLRHQRGIMDARIFHLFNKKEIILPQLLEDEQYREVPSVHLFYRPARQRIYAILFNLYHQRYMYSKSAKEQKGGAKSPGKPEILIKEWIWSPQNEFARPELVPAEQLSWSVSTIQRLWFGMAETDKQRRMKAFLTVMRSDTPLMMNRSFVPQHMLVLACILRYIITNPDRSVLTRSELDAFLATAFSPLLSNVEYTQEMVLPGVNLRGVYLATLLMQGFETATMANDACGVPLPWLTTNPWLVFDGKLFQLKLKMTSCVQSLQELCEDHLEAVLGIERMKKAILEDAEHFLLPDPTAFRQLGNVGPGGFGNFGNLPLPLLQSVGAGGGAGLMGTSAYFGAGTGPRGAPTGFPYKTQFGQNQKQQQQQQFFMPSSMGVGPKSGHQLKVGGVVVGSWGSGYGGRQMPPPQMANLSTRYNQVGRGRNATQMLQNRLNRVSYNALPQIGDPYSGTGGYGSALNRGVFGIRGLGAVGGGFGVNGGGGGVNGRSMKAGPQHRAKGNKPTAGVKKQPQNAKKKNKGKKANVNKDLVLDVGLSEDLWRLKLSLDDGAEDLKESSTQALNLVTEMCDGLLNDENGEELAAEKNTKAMEQPKQVLTKKKLIQVGKKETLNGGGGSRGSAGAVAAEKGQGDTREI